jgi:hypothetical protein
MNLIGVHRSRKEIIGLYRAISGKYILQHYKKKKMMVVVSVLLIVASWRTMRLLGNRNGMT